MRVPEVQGAAPRAHAPRIVAEVAVSSELALCGSPGNPSACAGVQGALRGRSPSQHNGARDRDE
eukprot:10606676-Alexandrium_andersonii.AAC.1